MSSIGRFPEISDLVAVTIAHVEYYGYVDAIDYDLRTAGVSVEFVPGKSKWFRLDEIKFVEFPKERLK